MEKIEYCVEVRRKNQQRFTPNFHGHHSLEMAIEHLRKALDHGLVARIIKQKREIVCPVQDKKDQPQQESGKSRSKRKATS